MELSGAADGGATGGEEKSDREAEEAARWGSVRLEWWVRPDLLPNQRRSPPDWPDDCRGEWAGSM